MEINPGQSSMEGPFNPEQIHDQAVQGLRKVYDPEIPVNIYELGLIYSIDVLEEGRVVVTMTLTAPNCPAAEQLPADVRQKIAAIPGVREVEVKLTFEPAWTKDMMSEAAKLELGIE
jgi:FeS assembly SUF system protein